MVMRKANYAAHVSETTPAFDEPPCAGSARAAQLKRHAGRSLLDTVLNTAYSSLHSYRGTSDGEARANTAGFKGRGFGPRWRAQPTSRGRPRSSVQRQPVLRSQGSCSGSIRDGAPPSERRYRHHRRSRGLRRLATNLLQSAGRAGRPRSRGIDAATTWPKRRSQDIDGSALIRRRGEGGEPASDVAATDCHDRRALWTRCPPTKSGARACTKKK